MSLYQCEACGCVENTAKGLYYCRHLLGDGRALCSECAPTTYKDGTPSRYDGKWHGIFKKACYPLGSLYTDKDGNVRVKETDKYPEYSERTNK